MSAPSAIEIRRKLLGHRGFVAWMTGRPAAGKSTLSAAVELLLLQSGRLCCILDGDHLRGRLNKDLGFGPADRMENLRRFAEIAKLMADAGLVVLVAAISPLAAHREQARHIIGSEHFAEVYIRADISVCEQRDPKGNYRKARAGIIPDFTGIGSPYEPPTAPEVVIDTGSSAIAVSARQLADRLIELSAHRS